MKQSLRSYLPIIKGLKSLEEIVKLNGEVIVLEQISNKNVADLKLFSAINYYFVFGPEGGLDEEELNLIDKGKIYNLAENRLRSETAIIMFVAMLPALFRNL